MGGLPSSLHLSEKSSSGINQFLRYELKDINGVTVSEWLKCFRSFPEASHHTEQVIIYNTCLKLHLKTAFLGKLILIKVHDSPMNLIHVILNN